MEPGGLLVAPNGTAMAYWYRGTSTFTSVRAPGGAWGAPQTIVNDSGVNFVQLALGANGDAVAVWTDGTAPVGTFASVRPADGTWGTPETIAPRSTCTRSR